MLPIPGALNLQPGLHVFKILNKGVGDLLLTGSPTVEIAGTGAAHFNIDTQPGVTTLATDESTTFTVRFDPQEIGTHDATIQIETNDAAVGTFEFDVQGIGSLPAARMTFTAHDGGLSVGGQRQIGTGQMPFTAHDAILRVNTPATQIDTPRITFTAHDGAISASPFKPHWVPRPILID